MSEGDQLTVFIYIKTCLFFHKFWWFFFFFFAMCRIWDWKLFLSAFQKKSCHFLLVFNVCAEQLALSLFRAFLKVTYFISGCSWYFLCIYTCISEYLVSIVLLWCVSVCIYFVFISFVAHKTAWVCGLIFCTELWNLIHISSNIIPVPLCTFSPFTHIKSFYMLGIFIRFHMFLITYSVLSLFFFHCASFKLSFLPTYLSDH